VQTWELAVEVGISVASAGATALGMIWTLARRMQKDSDEAAETKKTATAAHDRLEKLDRELNERIEKLEAEVDEDRKQGADLWQDLNRTLGQIEGMMSGGPPVNPRGKLPSRGR
jgi:chromosome segregation ATPase